MYSFSLLLVKYTASWIAVSEYLCQLKTLININTNAKVDTEAQKLYENFVNVLKIRVQTVVLG